jgi:hypothetical protein
MPEANKIFDILQSERSFGRVVREIQVSFQLFLMLAVSAMNA